MIASRGMSSRVRFERGDAFNNDELAALKPRPTLGIVSGLYELFRITLWFDVRLLGWLPLSNLGHVVIYRTTLHPQLKTIAWSLTSHKDNKAWVMRIRTQGEMDALVHEADLINARS